MTPTDHSRCDETTTNRSTGTRWSCDPTGRIRPRSERTRPLIAFFDYHDVFEDFYPHYGVTQREFATTWANSGNHAFLTLIQQHIGDVVWYTFSLAPELDRVVHQGVGCQVRFLRSSAVHRWLWNRFYNSKHSWRWTRYYRGYATLASYSSLLSMSLLRALRQDHPDCFFVQDYATGRFDVLCGLAKLLGIPLIAYHAGSAPERYVGKVAKHWSLPRAQIITSSRRESQMLESRYGVSAENLHLVLTPIDVVRFCPQERAEACRQADLSPQRCYLLFVGRLDDRVKRVSAVIKAFAKIQHAHPQVDLLIAGDGSDFGKLRALAESLAPGRVRMLGWVSTADDRARLYNASEFLVLPSRSEGFPTVVGESLACGTPVLATDVGGVSELVVEGRSGWLLRPGDDDQLTERMNTLLSSPSLIHSARAEVRDLALQKISPNRVAAQLAGCFRAVIDPDEPY